LPLKGAKAVEIGTGWVPTVPLGLALLGAEVYTYDHLAHLRNNNLRTTLDLLHTSIDDIARQMDLDRDGLRGRLDEFVRVNARNPRAWLDRIGVHYNAPADAAQTGLPPETVDIHFSVNVLEHIPSAKLTDIFSEAYRVLKPKGLLWHGVDTSDEFAAIDPQVTHFNCLKYSALIWRLIGQNKIHYINRLRKSEYLKLFGSTGFKIIKVDALITPEDLTTLEHIRVNRRFRSFDKTELAMRHFIVAAQKAATAS